MFIKARKMSRANKNIREIVSNSRASDRAKSSTNLQAAASNGKITTMRSSNANLVTQHYTADAGIKASGGPLGRHN